MKVAPSASSVFIVARSTVTAALLPSDRPCAKSWNVDSGDSAEREPAMTAKVAGVPGPYIAPFIVTC